jgi:hypothetical protein
MATLSDSYCTAARKMSSFYDKAFAEAGLRVAQYSIFAAVERRVDEPPAMKKTGGGPRHGSIDAWAEPSSTGTRGTHHDVPEQRQRAQQADLSFSAWLQTIRVARNVWKLAQRECARIGGRASADHGHNVMNALAMNQQL